MTNKHKINNRKKKRKRYNAQHLSAYRQAILEHENSIWKPTPFNYYRYNAIVDMSDTWFTIKRKLAHDQNKTCDINNNYDYTFKSESELIKCKKVILFLNEEQKLLLHNWFDAYAHIYNVTIRYIKNNYDPFSFEKVKWENIRTNYLKRYRDDIIERSQMDKYIEKDKIIKNTKIKTHIADCAIQDACANYNTSIDNLAKKRIKHFRIRYWRKNKRTKTIRIEPSFFVKSSICPTLFGNIIAKYRTSRKFVDFDLNTVNKTCTIHYDKMTNIYTLLVPEQIKREQIDDQKRKIVNGDLGLRKFMTCLSENETLQIGTECKEVIGSLIKKKENMMKRENIPKKIRKKHELRINRKITNYVDELHWKVANYLTDNYSFVRIGDMSAKSIVSKNGNMSPTNKKLVMALNFYKFRQKLEYKCQIKRVKYELVNESYTSKVCTSCTNVNDKLGASEIYKCKKCGLKMDRDEHSGRGIHIKQFIKK